MVDDYNAKRNLIEAKYHLALAEAQVNETDDMSIGQSELQVAKCYVNRALSDADSNDRHQIVEVKNKMNEIAKAPQKDLHFCSDKQAALTRLHQAENKVGSLLTDL